MQASYQVNIYHKDPQTEDAESCQKIYGHSYFQLLATRQLQATDERFTVASIYAETCGPMFLGKLRELGTPDAVYPVYTFGQVWRNLQLVREDSEHLGCDLGWQIANCDLYSR
jgi:hypothetical protein